MSASRGDTRCQPQGVRPWSKCLKPVDRPGRGARGPVHKGALAGVSRATRADVVDCHRDRCQPGGGDDAVGGHPFFEKCLNRSGEGRLWLLRGASRRRSWSSRSAPRTGDDDDDGHDIARPRATEHCVDHGRERRIGFLERVGWQGGPGSIRMAGRVRRPPRPEGVRRPPAAEGA